MASHDELVAEMLVLEQMGTQERQKLAKRRRMQQLKKWSQREKEWLIKEKQLNKRLANKINEENNGLNLKQYTTYNSNQRAKKKLTENNKYIPNNISDEVHNSGNNKELKFLNNNYNGTTNNNLTNGFDGPYSNGLAPHGRVHFNVGIMLLEAAARNDYEEVKRLLTLGVSPDSVNHDGLTALHQCCIDASEPIMNLLLDFGANVDARDTEQWTPLHAACTCGHLNLVKILVEHDANLLAVNGDGNMPFDICEDEATLEYIETQMVARGITQETIDLTRATNEMQMLCDLEKLVANGCEPNVADNDGVTQLHIAAANNYVSAVKFLLDHGVDVNVCDNDQWRPLHGVACWGNEQHIKIIELLVESGANIDAKTANDETVFDLCDNINLLERLNQLKDELESKQAVGTGRLKRTQSKTNSRVHSVRRTSVRDKNQISRREAREEALLRVESNENLDNCEQKLSADKPDARDATIPYASAPLKEGQSSDTDAVDQPDCVDPIETNLDNEVAYSNRPTENGKDDKAESRTSKESHEQNISSSQIDTGSQQQKQQQNEVDTSQELSAIDDISRLSQPREATQLKVMSAPQLNKDNQSTTTTKRPATDLSGRLPAQSTTIVQVHFAPMNYTLSNLKKHRSDLRMRTAINGITSANTSIVQLNESIDYPNGTNNGQLITGSTPINGSDIIISDDKYTPDALEDLSAASFRKFHGEPSDAIEFRNNRGRYKCCIII